MKLNLIKRKSKVETLKDYINALEDTKNYYKVHFEIIDSKKYKLTLDSKEIKLKKDEK